MSRRLAQMRVSGEFFLNLGRGTYTVIENPIPADAKAVEASYSSPYDRFDIVFESAELPELKPGERIPVAKAPMLKRVEG